MKLYEVIISRTYFIPAENEEEAEVLAYKEFEEDWDYLGNLDVQSDFDTTTTIKEEVWKENKV